MDRLIVFNMLGGMRLAVPQSRVIAIGECGGDLRLYYRGVQAAGREESTQMELLADGIEDAVRAYNGGVAAGDEEVRDA